MEESTAEARPQVLIAGGGIAGLEALLALRDLAKDRVELTLIAPDPDFVYKPLTVEEPFSAQPAEQHALAPLAAELGARFLQLGLERVLSEDHVVELSDGSRLDYDTLVICVGGRPRAVYERAITFGRDDLNVDALIKEAAQASPARIAFVVPPGDSWPLPLYELALMTRRRAQSLGAGDVECVVLTPESAPLIMFGTRASDAVGELLRARGIEVRARTYATEDPDGGLVLTPADERLDAARVIALPKLEGRRIRGLPADEDGFIPIDEHARVRGVLDIYAAGDGTNFPIKQGGLGTQQADAAAEHIAASAGASIEPEPFHPVLRGQLITGGESLHFRHDVGGGAGEGMVSDDYLWWPPHKVGGRYLSAWLAHEKAGHELEPPRVPLDVEVALPKEWHEEPMALDPYGPLVAE
jgi:sulfide:quinone oxidoreductase